LPPPGAVPDWQDVINNDGSGWIYSEIQEQIDSGVYNIGLIGYSHGGGIIANLSLLLWNNRVSGQLAAVVFAGTIDAVAYGSGPDCPFPPLGGYYYAAGQVPVTKSPALNWQGVGVNYWEPNGWSDLPVHGTNMNGATNYEISSLNIRSIDHSSIGVLPEVLAGIEIATDNAFGELSGD
jgi:hypothetical protein